MSPTPVSGASEKNPTHHVVLTDGASTVGLMLIAPDGKGGIMDDPHAISRSAYPRTSTKIGSGASKYDDQVPPYLASVQDSTVGGRGADIFDDDKTRFADNYRTVTTVEKNVMLGARDSYSKGNDLRNQDHVWPGDHSGNTEIWTDLYGATYFTSHSFVAGSAYTMYVIEIIIKRTGTPTTPLTVTLRSDNAGDPGTVRAFYFVTVSEVTDIVSLHIYRYANVGYAMGAGTTYWVAIQGGVADGANNHWSILGSSASAGKKSADGITWSAMASGAPYFRVAEQVATNEAEGFYFDYKQLKYFVTRGGKIYRNGTRGAADATSTTTAVDDTSKAMTVSQYVGAVMVISGGTGSAETQTWRRIADNTATQFQFSVANAWAVAPDITTEYIIKDTLYWEHVADLPQTTVKGCAVADEQVFFCHGDGKPVTYFYEYNAAGVWTTGTGTDDLTSIDHMIVTRHPVDGLVLWAARNNHGTRGSVVYKCLVPPRIGKTYKKHGTLIDNHHDWNEVYLSGVTQGFLDGLRSVIRIDAAVPTGSIVASKQIDPIDMTGSNRIEFGVRSSIAQAAGDIKFLIADRELSRSFTPDYVKSSLRQVPPDAVYHVTTTPAYFPIPQASWDVPSPYKGRYSAITMAATDKLYIGHGKRFDRIDVDVSVVNNNAQTLTAEYWNGEAWTNLAIAADGTVVAGATFAQNGAITFTAPNVWTQGMDATTITAGGLSTSLFWIRISVTGALDIVAARFRVRYTGESGATLESLQLTDLSIAKDGDAATEMQAFLWDTLGYLYVGFSEMFNKVVFNLGTAVNNNNSTLTGEYWNGEAWTAVTITDGTVTGAATMTKDGSVSFTTPTNWEKTNVGEESLAYWIRFDVSADLDAIDFKEIAVKQDAYFAVNLPALVADTSTWVALTIDHTMSNLLHPDLSRINRIGLKYDRAVAACDIILTTPVIYGSSSPIEDDDVISCGNSAEKILGLDSYGDERQNAWVFKEGSVGEIQAENNDSFVPIPLQELSAFYSGENARGHTTNDVYLMWTMGGLRVQRYYNRTLEDIGPDNDEGMPANRQGTIRQLLSLPGSVLAGIDAGIGKYSSILIRKSSGWHEIYRFPAYQRFFRMSLDVMPDEAPSRLWIACGEADIKCIQISKISKNPAKDSAMRYTHEGNYVTGWITNGFLDLSKLNSFLTLNSQNLSAGQNIYVDYQLTSGSLDSGWTTIGLFDTSPWQQQAVSAAYNVAGRMFRMRFRLLTNDATKTPILKAWILDELMRFPVKYAYTIRFRIRDNDVDMRGVADATSRAETKQSILDTWSTGLTVLTFTNLYSPFDNKKVVIEPMGVRPTGVVVKDGLEYHTAEATLLEV